MNAEQCNDGRSALPEPPEFSLVLGGPLYQLFRRAHLCGNVLELVTRRAILLSLVAWLPLLALSVAEGNAWGRHVELPFLYDLEIHARLLISLPLLVVAEIVVHQRMRPVVRHFVQSGLVPEAARSKFDAAVASAIRLRNSVSVEVLMIAFVYGVGVLLVWRMAVVLEVTGWYGVSVDGRLRPSLAGWWLGCVSLPLFQFLLLRWYFRIFIWARFLWQVSRIQLNIVPTHPDRCGGLGFLSVTIQALAPVLLAQGTMLAGLIASRIFHSDATLPDFKRELIGLVAVMVFAVLGPLLVFSPMLAAARRVGLGEYGLLAQRYVREFDQKWMRGGAAAREPLLGSPDIQSLADIGSAFDVIREMKLAPFSLRTVLQLAVITLLPVAPLLLTMMPTEELLDRALNFVF